MFRDESVYPDAHAFNPGRFLKDGQINPDVKDPEQVLFGYGRRYVHPQQTAIVHSSGNTPVFQDLPWKTLRTTSLVLDYRSNSCCV